MKVKSIDIIGSGNVGGYLYACLKDKVESVSIYNSTTFNELRSRNLKLYSDLIIIAVPDDSIEKVVNELSTDLNVVHTAGSVSLDTLIKFKNSGVIYPLQSIQKNRKTNLNDIPFLIEGSTDYFTQNLADFVNKNLNDRVYVVDSGERLKIHLAAVVLNNFVTYLLNFSEEILGETKIDFNLLEPLLTKTVNNYFEYGYQKSQTGPARRNDLKTINKHLKMLESNSNHLEVYKILTKAIQQKFNT